MNRTIQLFVQLLPERISETDLPVHAPADGFAELAAKAAAAGGDNLSGYYGAGGALPPAVAGYRPGGGLCDETRAYAGQRLAVRRGDRVCLRAGHSSLGAFCLC